MSWLPRRVAVLALLVSAAGAMPGSAERLPPLGFPSFELATAEPGGIYVPLGRSLCILYNLRNLEQQPHLPSCRARLTSGSVDNVERLRRGEVQVAVVQGDVLHWAWTGSGPFADAGPLRDIAVLFTAHDEVIAVLAARDSGITSAAEIRGKRFAIGERESGSRATIEALMQAMSLSPADFATFEMMSVDAQVDALCAGRIDAVAFMVGHPSGHVQRALSDCGARLVPADSAAARAATETLPFLRMSAIPAGTYRGQDVAVAAPAVTALIVARRNWSALTAQAFSTAIRSQQDILRRMHPALADLDLDRPDGAAEEVGIYRPEAQ